MRRRPDPAPGQELSVGEVARRSGVAVSTLHFYEAEGLIHSRRSPGNQRRYPRAILRRVAVLKVAQRAGVPLRDIAETLAALPEGRPIAAADWARFSSQWKADLEARIRRLEALRDQLGDCIGCGCLSLEICPLRNPGDHLGRNGSGARLIETDDGEASEQAARRE